MFIFLLWKLIDTKRILVLGAGEGHKNLSMVFLISLQISGHKKMTLRKGKKPTLS